jgi:hypothetical protein
MLQDLVSRKGSDFIKKSIITLSFREACGELWGFYPEFHCRRVGLEDHE